MTLGRENNMKIKVIEDGKFDNITLNETFLSRLNHFTDKYSICFITAFKGPAWIRDNYESNDRLSPREVVKINRERNNNLLRDIKSHGYNSFKVDGRYENQERKEKATDSLDTSSYTNKEESFGVINNDSSEYGMSKFIDAMISLGNKYDQESILIIHEQNKEGTFYYLNASNTPGKTESAGKMHFGNDYPFKSLIDGRPMYLESISNIFENHTGIFHR